jgi:chromosome segregation ATPase
MWEAIIAGAGGFMSLYLALRREVRRSHELLQKDIGHLQGDNRRLEQGQTEIRSDIRRVDQKIDAVRGELIGFLGSR